MNKDEKRQARILALQVFFSFEQQKFEGEIDDIFNKIANFSEIDEDVEINDLIIPDPNSTIDKAWKIADADSPSDLSEDVKCYALALVENAAENRKDADETLTKLSTNWSFDRISTIDRNLLRIAIAELDEKFDVPPKVVINEAIEIAKIFGTDDSAKFVNAILDKVKTEKEK
ncbi:MAG: transcription antitermination factor NusB [Chitinivibrionia bacterium]|nr:transcription antitermination factor NusB [Chitinivibrionia bacterium]